MDKKKTQEQQGKIRAFLDEVYSPRAYLAVIAYVDEEGNSSFLSASNTNPGTTNYSTVQVLLMQLEDAVKAVISGVMPKRAIKKEEETQPQYG